MDAYSINRRRLPMFRHCPANLIVLLLLFGYPFLVQSRELNESETMAEKVSLRWKFTPTQVLDGKLAFGIRTIDDNPRHTSFVYEYVWEVQSLRDDGSALAKLIVNRERFQHQSANGKVKYDSNNDASFMPPETILREIQPFVDIVRRMHKQEYLFTLSHRGEIQLARNYEYKPGQLLSTWPILPEQPVGVGDTWSDRPADGKAHNYELIRLNEIDGQRVAWIERKNDTRRFRFLVDEGRYLDNVYWNIVSFSSREGKPSGSYLQSYSQRCRLELSGANNKSDRWQALQPNQPGRAMHLLASSIRQTDKIEEYLWGERGFLTRIQIGLYLEHAENMDFPEPSPQWEPMDWLMSARILERSGEFDKRRNLLKDGVDAIASISSKSNMTRNAFLIQLADLLAKIGEFEDAKKACLEISPEALAGLNVTASGSISVPKSSMLNYGLLTVAREQAKSGLADESTKTAKSITDPPIRSAAHWVVAMHLADLGENEAALENVTFAEKEYAKEAKFIEFDSQGPVEVAVQSYRTLALGRVAVCQAKQGDEGAMRKTVSMIKDAFERNAVLVDLIVALDKEGMTELVDKLSNELPEPARSTEIAYRVAMRLQSKDFDDVAGMIEAIHEPSWQAASRMNFCLLLKSHGASSDELEKQLGLTKSAIEEISDPLNRASSLIDFAVILVGIGKAEEAGRLLSTAIDLVSDAPMEPAQRVDMQLRIAKVLAGLTDAKKFEDLMGKLETTADSLKVSDKARIELSMVDVYLEKDNLEKGESIADKIKDASLRCQALAAVGKRHAQLLELELSREVFAKAYDSAMKVIDVASLDTVHSKGGAIRFVAHEQGECDLEGLVQFLEESTNPNIKAYGSIGGVEALAPDAAMAAKKIGRIPEAILKDVCESNIACQLLEGQLQLPDESQQENRKQPK